MPNQLEGEPALRYLRDIRNTCQQASQPDNHPYYASRDGLFHVNSLVTLELAYLTLLKKEQRLPINLPLSTTGLPELPILLSHVEAALREYQDMSQSAKQAMVNILDDLGKADDKSLAYLAPQRTQTLVFSNDFMRTVRLVEPSERHEAYKTTQLFQGRLNPKSVPEWTMVSEEQGFLIVETHRSSSWSDEWASYKFIPVKKRHRPRRSFFLFFHSYQPLFGEQTFWTHTFIPDRSTSIRKKKTNIKRSGNIFDISMSNFLERNDRGTPFNLFLTQFDPTAYPEHNQTIFALIIEIDEKIRKLVDFDSLEKMGRIQMEALQGELAVTLRKIDDLPEEVAAKIKTALRETMNKVLTQKTQKKK